jgi:hypothetical protein
MIALKRPCIFVRKDTGEKFQSSFIIHEPQPKDNGENYSCLCEITGVTTSQIEVFGYDPIQAVELSMWQLQIEFTNLLQTFEIHYPEGGNMESFISANTPLWPNT